MKKVLSLIAIFIVLCGFAVSLDAGWYATNRMRPVLDGMQISTSNTANTAVGSLEAVVLAKGQPWAVYPVWLDPTYACTNSVQAYPYYSGYKLWQINRYSTTNVLLYQPQTISPTNLIGYSQVWDSIANHTSIYSPGFSAAGAALDSNNVYGDMSLYPSDYSLGEMVPYAANGSGFNSFTSTGISAKGATVTIYTGDFNNTGSYNIPAQVIDYGNLAQTATTCNGTTYLHWTYGNMRLVSQGRTFQYGDGGSPVVTDGRDGGPAGILVGWLEWADLNQPLNGGGADVRYPKTGLNFDGYYTARSGNLYSWLVPQTSSSLAVGQEGCSYLYVWNQNKLYTASLVQIDFKKDPYSPATFKYYNPASQLNTPYDIPANQVQLFYVCATSATSYPPRDYRFIAYGAGNPSNGMPPSRAPVVQTALNTMMMRWDSTALANFTIKQVSPSNDAIVSTGGAYGTATVKITAKNIGASSTVTVATDTNTLGVVPSISSAICETTSTFSGCLQPAVSHFSVTWNTGVTKYFLETVQGLGSIVPKNWFYNRVYYRVYNGVSTQQADTVGSASLAVTTN